MSLPVSPVRFEPQHLAAIAVQAAQQGDWPDSAERDRRAQAFAAQDHCWSFLDSESGAVLACFGLVRSHAEHLTAWAVLSEGLGTARLAYATRWCAAYLAAMQVRRIDIAVRAGFAAGNRWARLLGFGPEGRQRAFFADGEDMIVHAMIDSKPANRWEKWA